MNFLSNEDCLQFLTRTRWDGIVISPFAANSKVYYCSSFKYKCQATGKYFNAKTGTIFANTRISLLIWFKALEILNNTNTITSSKLALQLGVSQKTAWHMQKKINSQLPKEHISHVSNQDGSEAEKLNMLDWLILHKKNG